MPYYVRLKITKLILQYMGYCEICCPPERTIFVLPGTLHKKDNSTVDDAGERPKKWWKTTDHRTENTQNP
jgi:hypothetical protein